MLNTPLFFDACPLLLEDLKQVYDWKYHPKTFEMSFSENKPSFDLFVKEAHKKFHSIKTLPPVFIIYNNNKVGLIYFEKWHLNHSCQISIFLNPDYQKRAIGKTALKKACLELSQKGYKKIVAFVKKENIGAQKAFEKAGFDDEGSVFVPKYGNLFPALKYTQNFSYPTPKTFIIAEIGSNFSLGDHSSSLEFAKKLIEKAASAGASAVKFQLFHPKGIYVPNAGVAGYLKQNINEIFEKYALPPPFIPKLYEHARYLGIEFMCSFFSKEDFKIIDPYVQRHKIASYEIRHIRLLELAAKSQKPLLLSTGCASIEDIEWAKEVYFKSGGKNLTLLQCTGQYPAETSSLNLKCLKTLQERFKLEVGLSDHSSHPLYAPIAAVSLGATVIEKHVTLHQNLIGPDHFFSINFEELKEMCNAIYETEKILGVEKKEIIAQEEELAAFARRGIHAIQPIKKGDLLKEDVNIAILRPGEQKLGLHPKHIEACEGKKALLDIPLGKGLQKEDITW